MPVISKPGHDGVLIIGAGATGLMLACELARHGMTARIIDRLPGIVPFARATGVHSRTLEVFQDLGIADEVIARAVPVRGANQFAGGELIMHFRTDGLDSPFPFSISLEQWKVEESLEKLLARQDVTVERETELIALREQSNGVEVTLRHADGSTEVAKAAWLVGCDGAHSMVRHLKGEHFPGDVDPRQYLIGDVVLDGGHASDEVFVYLSDHGALWWFPLPEGRSLVAGDVREQHDGTGETPRLEDMQGLIRHRAPPGISARDPRWLSWFHIHYRLTPHYRHGRTLLAGDAAHVHSPIGGQGMNTGIQDAYNLGWKLALVARGLAPETLLDSYEAERRAVAEDVLATTRSVTEKAEAYLQLPPEERTRLYRHVTLPEADRLKMVHHSEELDLDYRRSPICKDWIAEMEGAQAAAGKLHAGAEARDVHPLIVDGARQSLFELLRGTHHTLIVMPQVHTQANGLPSSLKARLEEVVNAFGDQVRVLLALPEETGAEADLAAPVKCLYDPDGALHRRYGATEGRIYLIRPDGYIGFRGESSDFEVLMNHLDLMFPRQ